MESNIDNEERDDSEENVDGSESDESKPVEKMRNSSSYEEEDEEEGENVLIDSEEDESDRNDEDEGEGENDEQSGDEDQSGDDNDNNDDEQNVKLSSQDRKRNVQVSGNLKSNKRRRQEKKGKSRKVLQFFDEEAEEDDDDEEDEYEARHGSEEVMGEDEKLAVEAVVRRHELARETLDIDASELARDFEERARRQRAYEKMQDNADSNLTGGPKISTVVQQSLLPSVNDPSIWRIKVKTGMEQQLVLSIMRKALDSKMKGGPLRIKSAFCKGLKGYIYVEAIAEPLAREAILGLRGIYQSSLTKIAVQEMTAVVTISKLKNPLSIGQWVRLKRGPLKGDLARIVDIFEGGTRVLVQAIPRPDYSITIDPMTGKGTSIKSQIRPAQQLFDPQQTKLGECIRKYNPIDNKGGKYDYWNNDYYRDGYLYKDVNPMTYLQTEKVAPKMEEMKMFINQKAKKLDQDKYDDDEDPADEPDDDDEFDEDGEPKKTRSLVKELAEQLQSLENEATEVDSKLSPYVVGDLVQVISGELHNLVARITSVNQLNRTVTVTPSNSILTGEFTIEMSVLVKYVPAGSHVKVIGGRNMGQTGRVVNVKVMDGKPTAVILTDGINTEILCDVINLQMSTEVTVGLGNLMGYELYDLVMLNENESAVVIGVGAEKLKVVNHMDIVKEIFPQEVQAKRNLQSQRSSGFDSEQNTVVIGDVVNVTSGPHAKLTGTVKHMMKGSFWLHSNMYLKNSGIFVTRGRYCIIAGAKSANHSQSKSQLASQSVSFSKPIRKVGKDENIGNTLRITKGQYKGLLCQVIDTIGDSYIVELLAKLKKITIEKSKTVIVGTKHGSLGGSVSNGPAADGNIPQTPSYSLATPYQYQGMATPRYGADTPGYQTPNPHAREEDNMIWSFNANFSSDRTSIPQSSSNSGNDSRSDPYNFSSSSRISSSPWIGESESSIVASARGNNRSPQSPFESNASQTSSLYSPSNGADTSSINPGMNGGRNASGGISFRDWTPNLVVVFKEAPYAGRLGVIRDIDLQMETVKVQLRNDKGLALGNAFSAHPSELSLAEPGKKAKVIILSGQNKGRTGVVKAVAGRDVILEASEDSRPAEVFKLTLVGWLNS